MTDVTALREEYERKMGKKPFYGWSPEEIRARMNEPEAGEMPRVAPRAEAPREKTLHELNLESLKYDRQIRGLNNEASEAAKKAVLDTLNEKRPDGRRTRKDLRPVAE